MTSIDTIRTTPKTEPRRTTPIWRRALNWLAQRDAAYRQAQKLRAMPDERLDDMGITREQVDRLF